MLGQSLLAEVGLDRRDTQSWVLFDWGDNAFATVVLGVILPIYYVEVAGASLDGNLASVYWGYTLAISFTIVAVVSPILGAIADHTNQSRRFLGLFTLLGVVFTGALVFTGEESWLTTGLASIPGLDGDETWLLTSVLAIVANVGFSGARLFYNSLLPGITTGDTIDRVSTAGYAMGYFGGGTLLVVALVLISMPETFGLVDTAAASRLSLFLAACWWAVFAMPLFIYVPESDTSQTDDEIAHNPVVGGYRRLSQTYAEIQQYKVAFTFLVAFWFYTNGIQGIITLSAAFGSEIGLAQTDIMLALVMVQFVGVPCAFGFGKLADMYSTKRMLFAGLVVYICVSILAAGITAAWHFFALAFAIALVQGGTQALSRSLFGSLIPEHKSAEFFSFFAIVAGFASILAPLVFSFVGQITGSTRIAVGTLSVFFIVGTLLLLRVDVETGRSVAQDASPAPGPTEHTTS
jgi:UMF1 family MFS transporter